MGRPAFVTAAILAVVAFGVAPPVMASSVEVLAERTPEARLTAIARLDHAPFPLAYSKALDPAPLFTGRDPRTGEGVRVVARNRYLERRTYTDNRVLVHVPPGFDPGKPVRILVFFHGHLAELKRSVIGEYGIVAQINRSGRNVILIAPQLALDAADSHPGKLARQNGLSNLLDEVLPIVARRLGLRADAFAGTQVFIAAFSGGYRAVAESITHGGAPGRIAGLILLDALFGDLDRFVRWFARNDQRVFLVVIYTPYSAKLTEALRARLRGRNVIVETRLPREIGEDDNVFLRVASPHLRVPFDGPPPGPVAEVLRRLPRFESYLPLRGSEAR